MVNASDNMLSCYQINAEIAANNQDLARQHGWKVAQNVTAGVAGIVIWPLWFDMDWQGAAWIEATRCCKTVNDTSPDSPRRNVARIPSGRVND
jgi:hypothetical protein